LEGGVELHRKRAKTEQLFWGSILGGGGSGEQVLGLKGPPAMSPSPTYLCRRESLGTGIPC